MDDRALPPLSGLCLHEQLDEESAPDETSGPAQPGIKPIGRNDGEYQLRLQRWKNLPRSFGRRGRWEDKTDPSSEHRAANSGRFPYYFQYEPTFYQNWVPIAQHEGLCKKRRFGAGVEGLIFPPQFLVRVISDALDGVKGVASLQKPVVLVDGSNMFESGTEAGRFLNMWRKKIQDPREDRIVICFIKTDTLQERLFGGSTANKYFGDGGVDPPGTLKDYERFQRIKTLLGKLTTHENQIFLVQIEPWGPARDRDAKQGGGCILDPDERGRTRWGQTPEERGMPEGFAHLWCEFDDILLHATKKFLIDNQHSREVDVMSDDGGIQKDPAVMYEAFHKYLEYNDIFLLRVFQTRGGFVNNYKNIRQTFSSRYTHPIDYLVPSSTDDASVLKTIGLWDIKDRGFNWELFMGTVDVESPRSAPTPDPSYENGTWFSNQKYPVPPGWAPTDPRYQSSVIEMPSLKDFLQRQNPSLVDDYETWWREWQINQRLILERSDLPVDRPPLPARPGLPVRIRDLTPQEIQALQLRQQQQRDAATAERDAAAAAQAKADMKRKEELRAQIEKRRRLASRDSQSPA
jgi:hypothetical protein